MATSLPSPATIPVLPSPLTMLLFLVLPLLAAVLSSLFFSKKKKMNITTTLHPLPPSPPKIPIIGNLHQLSSLPHRTLRSLSDHHGPLMLLHFGRLPVLVASSPSIAREITQTHDYLFADRCSLKASTTLLYKGRDIAFAPYGDYWREAKKASVLHLLSNKKVDSYKRAREEEVAFMMNEIEQVVAAAPAVVDMTEYFSDLSSDVISRAVVGEPSRGTWWGEMLTKLIRESSRLSGEFYIGDYIPWLGMIVGMVSGFEGRVIQTFERADEVLDRMVKEHMREIEKRKKEKGREAVVVDEEQCFLDLLLTHEEEFNARVLFDKESIKAIIQDMFGAGTESTSITMEWCLAELLCHPTAMKKLKEEITKVVGSNKTLIKEEDLAKMSYLKAVIKETLRLHPPGPLLVPRQLMEDTHINGYRIPKGTMVLINVWAIGRDPQVWDSPEEFRPERFINGEASNIHFTSHGFQLLPFGAGRRSCPGIQFSVTLIELAIANLVHAFDWRPAQGQIEDMDMVEVFGLTTRKRGGLLLIATKAAK